jgi:hypothetical protein
VRTVVVVAALVAVLAGCRGGESDSEPAEGWTAYAPQSDGAAASCSPDRATPIRELQARTTLRGHGFSVRSETSGPCPGGVAAVLSSRPKDFDEDGSVSCFLYGTPPAGAPTRVVRRGVDGGDAELLLRNLTCTIFTDSPTGEEKIDRLEAAFAELERATRS